MDRQQSFTLPEYRSGVLCKAFSMRMSEVRDLQETDVLLKGTYRGGWDTPGHLKGSLPPSPCLPQILVSPMELVWPPPTK